MEAGKVQSARKGRHRCKVYLLKSDRKPYPFIAGGRLRYGDQVVAFTTQAVRQLSARPENVFEFTVSGKARAAVARIIADNYGRVRPYIMYIARTPGAGGSFWMQLPESVRREIEKAIAPLQVL